MGQIKVLFLSHSAYINGAEVCLLTLLKTLNRERFSPVVVFPGDGPLREKVESLSIVTYITNLERWIRYDFDPILTDSTIHSRVDKICDIIKKERIQIVHTNTSVIHEGALAAYKSGVPHVWHIHETLDDHPEITPNMPYPLIYKAMDYLSERIVVVADSLRDQFKDIISAEKLLTIYNGIEAARFVEINHKTAIRGELNIPDDTAVAVLVGAVTHRKGYPILLKAAEILKKQNAKIKFLWVGAATPEVERDFNRQLAERGLRETVHHLGFRSDIPDILLEADFLVLPSINEAFPMVILEAMAAGKPVIATNCGGCSESVEHNKTGYIVPVNDPLALSKHIQMLIDSGQTRTEMSIAARKSFLNKFTERVNASMFERLYSDTINTYHKRPTVENGQILLESVMDFYKTYTDLILAAEQIPTARTSFKGLIKRGLDRIV